MDEKKVSLLEEALLHLDSLCDGARESDGHGFNKEDSEILRPRAAKLIETGILDDRKDTLKRLKKYKNTQLAPGGFSYEEIVRLEKGISKDKSTKKSKEEIKIDPIIKEKALYLLQNWDLVYARRKYIGNTLYGNEHAIDALTYIFNSAYLGHKYVIHADIVGESQAGKSTVTVKSLDLMPQEDIIPFSEMSPKYVYYKAKDTDFTNKILYIDDARKEHIPILKTLRNDSEGGLSHGTVIDGEAVDMMVKGRPAVIASSVKPLRDLEGQAANRSLLITIEKPSKETEAHIHAKIRQYIGKGAIRASSGQDEEMSILQQASRILRDEGIKDIIVPFDAEAPKGCGNRATAQFARIIVISAFIHQLKRPILHLRDKKFVLAIYEDLNNALDIWHGLGIAHILKTSPTGLKLLRHLSIEAPNPDKGTDVKNVITSQKLHERTGIPERTITAHLEDLYEAGLVSRCKIKAQGSPFAYWTDPDLSKLVNAEEPITGDIEEHLSNIRQESSLPKYGPKYSSDCLKSRIIRQAQFLPNLAEISEGSRHCDYLAKPDLLNAFNQPYGLIFPGRIEILLELP
jgi:DNA-binding transcriptional ArsR family regulator